MRARGLLLTGATALMIGALPVAAVAQDGTTGDANDLDGTFVPSAPGASGEADAAVDAETDTGAAADAAADADELPNTGGGLALLGGLAVAGGAALRGRRG